jgi:hypothetical protein
MSWWHNVPWLTSCHFRSLTNRCPEIVLGVEVVAALVRSGPSALPVLWGPNKRQLASPHRTRERKCLLLIVPGLEQPYVLRLQGCIGGLSIRCAEELTLQNSHKSFVSKYRYGSWTVSTTNLYQTSAPTDARSLSLRIPPVKAKCHINLRYGTSSSTFVWRLPVVQSSWDRFIWLSRHHLCK